VVGVLLLVLLGTAVIVGVVAGGRMWSDEADRWTARTAVGLALLGAVVAVSTTLPHVGSEELLLLLALTVAPVLLTAVPLVFHAPGVGARVLAAGCALALVAYVVVTGLSIGLFFAPAAVTLVLLAAARARQPAVP
jgi:hypothetical protein